MHKIRHPIQQEFQDNLINYLILITGGIGFLVILNLFRGEHMIQFLFLLFFIFFYIIWGIAHHYQNNKKINYRIVIEYIIFAFITIFLLKIIILP